MRESCLKAKNFRQLFFPKEIANLWDGKDELTKFFSFETRDNGDLTGQGEKKEATLAIWSIVKITAAVYNVAVNGKIKFEIICFGGKTPCLRRLEVKMIKKFLQCSTTRERIVLLSGTVLKDWSDQDLAYVLEALGLEKKENEAAIDKIARIEKYLADYKHEVEQKASMDCQEMDSIPEKESGSTLYEEKGLGHLMAYAMAQQSR